MRLAPVPAVLREGRVIAGYQIEEVLGRGATGTVYAATQVALRRPAALKLLRADLAADPSFVERFRREARRQAALEHPHIVGIYEAGEAEGTVFIAMQLVRGASLDELLRRGELPAARALALLAQVAAALDFAHGAGVVHRDVTPRNVLVGPDDHAYLADFGLARDAGEPSLTRPGGVVGTLQFLAPEQVRGEPVTPAADVYGLTATAFACLVGQPPFAGRPAGAVLHSHLAEAPPAASDLRRELPDAVDAVLRAGLAKNPADRPARASDAVASLADALGPAAAELRSPIVAVAAEPGAPGRRRARVVGPLVAAVVAAAALVVALLGGGGPSLDERPAPAPLRGTRGVGSTLEPGGARALACPPPDASSCSVQQLSLRRGRPLVVPTDGLIRAWTLRGASGPVALQLTHGPPNHPIFDLQSRVVVPGDRSVHRYRVLIPVHRGEQLGVELGPGATIGARPAAGARLRRWALTLSEPYPGGAVASPGIIQDRPLEVLLRIEYTPGAAKLPGAAEGRVAAALPPGARIGAVTVALSAGSVDAVLVRAGGRVCLDLLRDGRRYARMPLPGLALAGRLRQLSGSSQASSTGIADIEVAWRNPGGGAVSRTVRISLRRIIAVS